jgi:hypothetical protein
VAVLSAAIPRFAQQSDETPQVLIIQFGNMIARNFKHIDEA